MKTKEEIEKLAEESRRIKGYTNKYTTGFIEGYTQCQQDNAALIACLEQKITMMQRVFDGIAHFTNNN